ncbi:hypothetical protein [Oryza sativa Japonica Group]|uniref:Uncharacterized protein n=1 Tax=Oryza sativa subsp. japonica TaxID=39947 RepID=Q5JNI7_ORYSJ|nr:hypothetical protein [Oryza sativa Japonica Group]
MGQRDEKGGSKILALTVDAKGSVTFNAVVGPLCATAVAATVVDRRGERMREGRRRKKRHEDRRGHDAAVAGVHDVVALDLGATTAVPLCANHLQIDADGATAPLPAH